MVEVSQASLQRAESTPAATDPPPRRRGRRLGSLHNVRSALADVVRRLEAGNIEVGVARAEVYALSTLGSLIVQTDVEQRLTQLEERLRGRSP